MKKLFYIFIFIIPLIQSCSNNTMYEQNVSFKNEQWHKDSSLVFNVEVTDTNQVYDIYFYTRISGNYPYQNMYLFINSQLPNNKQMTDTVEYILAEPNGKWLGKGFGSVWSYKLPYRRYIKFPFVGTYTFTIQQAMRTDNLSSVLDAGIGIEKNQ